MLQSSRAIAVIINTLKLFKIQEGYISYVIIDQTILFFERIPYFLRNTNLRLWNKYNY